MNTQNIKYLTKTKLYKKVLSLNDKYWINTWSKRWSYMWKVISTLKVMDISSILEIGAYKINLTNISDNMDIDINYVDTDNINNITYIQDAGIVPWNIKDKQYDMVIGLQVFEHFNDNKQIDVFKEIERISKNCILSFPYMWDSPNDLSHHMISDEKINEWTNNVKPDEIILVNTHPKRKRIIYIYNFNK